MFANRVAWTHPRAVQHVAKAIVTPVMEFLLDRAAPQAQLRREDISPFHWVNGKMPTSDEWKNLAAQNFRDYRLRVFGLAENPVELSLDDLRAMAKKTQIALHHCISALAIDVGYPAGIGWDSDLPFGPYTTAESVWSSISMHSGGGSSAPDAP